MPGFDGKGPVGDGPLTGRGRGICSFGIRNLARKKSSTLGFISLAVPVVVTVINDACKSDGITRRLYSAIKGKLTGTPDKKTVNGSSVIYLEDGQKKE